MVNPKQGGLSRGMALIHAVTTPWSQPRSDLNYLTISSLSNHAKPPEIRSGMNCEWAVRKETVMHTGPPLNSQIRNTFGTIAKHWVNVSPRNLNHRLEIARTWSALSMSTVASLDFSRERSKVRKTRWVIKTVKNGHSEGHFRADYGNTSDSTTLRFKPLTKDNFGQLWFSWQHISATGDFSRWPETPKVKHPPTLPHRLNKPGTRLYNIVATIYSIFSKRNKSLLSFCNFLLQKLYKLLKCDYNYTQANISRSLYRSVRHLLEIC